MCLHFILWCYFVISDPEICFIVIAMTMNCHGERWVFKWWHLLRFYMRKTQPNVDSYKVWIVRAGEREIPHECIRRNIKWKDILVVIIERKEERWFNINSKVASSRNLEFHLTRSQIKIEIKQSEIQDMMRVSHSQGGREGGRVTVLHLLLALDWPP